LNAWHWKLLLHDRHHKVNDRRLLMVFTHDDDIARFDLLNDVAVIPTRTVTAGNNKNAI
jgi:hypothetical protein